MKGRAWLLGIILVVLSVLFGTGLALCAGFALYEGSARGNALGGTMVGRADDPSALFYNPAGITQLPGLQVMGGMTGIMPKTEVTTTSNGVSQKTRTEDNIWVPPHLYTSYQASDRVWLGLGVFSPFGLGTEFERHWPGRFNNYNAVIQTMTINPNVAFKLNDMISLAGGLEFMYFDLKLKQSIAPFGVDQSLRGDSFGYGWNLALHFKPKDWIAFGISYRSQVAQNVEGHADFSNIPANLTRFAVFTDTAASGTILLPDTLFTGLMIKPMDRLSLELGGIWTNWRSYKALTIAYDVPILGPPITRHLIKSVTREKNWHDAWRLQVGAEYKATDWLDLRMGYVFDEEPVNSDFADYLVPANDRHLFSFGPGFHWNGWTVDLSYTYIYITDRNVQARPADGVLDSKFRNGDAHLVGLSLGYKF